MLNYNSIVFIHLILKVLNFSKDNVSSYYLVDLDKTLDISNKIDFCYEKPNQNFFVDLATKFSINSIF